jgi:drug/metabolite transporter (DMT)-like permease
MSETWYFFALGALVLMGVQRFLYKVSAERNCNTAWTTFAFMGTVAVLSAAIFLFSGADEPNFTFLLVVSVVNSLSFLLATVTHIEALKAIPTSIAMAVAVMLILTREAGEGNSHYGNTRRGVLLASLSLVGGAVASVSSKFAAIYDNPLAYMALSYLLSTLFSFGLRRRFEQQGVSRDLRPALLIGLAMGLINFVGYYLFLKALALGPLSIVISLTGMHFVIPIVLSVLFYGERLHVVRILAVAMTIASIILLRL